MNERIQELFKLIRKQKHTSNLMSNPPQVRYSYTIDEEDIKKFAKLIVEQCVGMCGSQADKKNISLYFGLPTEPDVKYPAAEESWSVKSQYNREYNYPK
jgi:hypothetical protein